MRHYKLLKDTPTIKAGTIFEEVVSDFDGAKELARITPVGAKTNPQWTIRDIDNFGEWFEEIQEPTDSIHWKPKFGDEYWFTSREGFVTWGYWSGGKEDAYRWRAGEVYCTQVECEQALDRKLAEVKLRRTSIFEPDFKSDNGGWVVFYDPQYKTLATQELYRLGYGRFIRYKTREEAEKSIKENKKDWLIYFGVKEKE